MRKLELWGLKSSNRKITSTKRGLSYDASELPPELWAIIATFASRQSLARLCSASHEFYSNFSPLLYGNLIDPPLTAAQSSALVTALSATQTPFRQPHAAERIQRLGLTGASRGLDTIKAQSKAATDALRNMYRLIPGAESTSGAVLRAISWDLAAGLDELGAILGAPGHYPNLKELFIQIRGLEVLGFTLTLDLYDPSYEAGDKLCYKLAEAIQMLPSSSPLLHTLRLKLDISYTEYEFPHAGHSDLIASINLIHLPVLKTLELSVTVDPDMGVGVTDLDFLPSANFRPFLASHTTLTDLTLSARGTELTKDISFLPQLHSFHGSFEDSALLCDSQRQLDKLVITFVHPLFSDDFFPAFRIVPLASHLSLTKLYVLAVDSGGSVVKLTNELSPASFAQLVTSFPNLTHLDVCISERTVKYREKLILLTKLQSLRLQEYRTSTCTHFECGMRGSKCWESKQRLTKVFPPSDYIAEFALSLPSLPQLAFIEISILADHISEFPEQNEDMIFEPPEMTVDYRFSVVRRSGGAQVVFKNAHATSDTR
ncbi:hypothetical protein B0H19DRAFT_1089938 [Mycena capillaripes]|nr:hypothetical protein B0H19DRAFT_1089938 [Mycena capillaripes]